MVLDRYTPSLCAECSPLCSEVFRGNQDILALIKRKARWNMFFSHKGKIKDSEGRMMVSVEFLRHPNLEEDRKLEGI